MANPCFDKILSSAPELIAYLEKKSGKKYDPETKIGREELLQAAKELKQESANDLASIHSQIGNNEFEKVPPVEPPKETVIANENEGIGITHAETSELRKETGLEQYDKQPQTIEQWRKEADRRIANGEMPSVIKKMKEGGSIDEIEQIMIGKHIATLDAEVAKSPTNENLKALKEAVDLSDKIGGTVWGRLGRARQETFVPDDSLGTALIKEMDALGVNELPEKVKEQVVKEHEELAKLKVELEKSAVENERLQKELLAKDELNKIRKSSNRKANEKRDFVAERQTLKDKLKQLIKDYKAEGQKLGIASDGNVESFIITAKMAKTIGEIIKSHVEETVLKLDEVVNRVFEDIKDLMPGSSKKDILDVMSGVYNEKRPTRNELAERMRNLRSEAVLLTKLQNERLGKPKTVKEQTAKSRRQTDLENKIKEVRKRNKDNEPVEAETDNEVLVAKRKSIQKKIDVIQADVKAGKFELPEREPYIKLDNKTQALQDRLIELEAQQLNRRQKAEYAKTSRFSKAADTFWQAVGLRRFINAAIDFSILFRQAAPVTMNVVKYLPSRNKQGKLVMGTAPRAIADMFNVSFNPKGFARFQYNIEKSEDGRLFTHFNGTFSNPTEVKMDKREEEFTNNILARIHQKIGESGNKTLQKTADILNRIWFSERAAAGLLNSIRIQEFSKGEIGLRKKGITPENSPQEYEDLVKWVMNKTGRGNMLKVLEDSHAGRIIANRTYFGARLMAAKINMLNPATYVRMSPAVRVQALKDMAGYVSSTILLGLALKASGASVNMNWDDPDFLQVRFGKKIFDISGGSVGYIRTFLRVMEGTAKASKDIVTEGTINKSDLSYLRFMGGSAWRTLVANKLSPNTAYAYHFFTGKSAEYDESGHLKPFDPLEVTKIYPLYVDGTIQAYREGGVADAMTILIPDLLGIGTQQYNTEGGTGGGGGATSTIPATPANPKNPKQPKQLTPQ